MTLKLIIYLLLKLLSQARYQLMALFLSYKLLRLFTSNWYGAYKQSTFCKQTPGIDLTVGLMRGDYDSRNAL
jgi:hypothetical protein